MRRRLLFFIVAMLFCLFLFTGCSTPIPVDEPTTEAVLTATSAATAVPPEPTVTFAPTATITPTATPEPIPCTIAFESDRDGNLEIYHMASDGSGLENLTNNSGDDFDPAFSADGSQIAFVSNRAIDDMGGQFIYVMNTDGSAVRKLTPQDGSRNPDWSPDGAYIVYSNQEDIFIMKADGSEVPINLSNGPDKDVQPDWSPDGQHIAWLSGSEENWNIFVIDLQSSQITQLNDDGKTGDVLWTVDGQLFFHSGHQENGCFNCVMDADGTSIKDAGGKGTIQEYLPYWTDQGERVECISGSLNGGNDEIYLVGEIYPDIFLNLTNDPANDRNPDWPAQCGPNLTSSESSDEQEQNAPAQSPKQFVFGYEDSENNMSAQKEADLLKACDELQVECIRNDDLSKLAEQNVDAILSFSSRWHVLGSWPAFQDVASKGILLIVLNAETGVQGAYNLSTDNDSVRASLEWMFNDMGKTGEFVYYNFGQNGTHQSLIDQVLKAYPDIKATAMPAEYDGSSMTEDSIAALAASNPNLKAIWADEWLGNLFWGLKNNHVEAPPAILCEPRADMLQYWQGYMNENSSFRCFSSIQAGGTAYEGVYVAYYILSGAKIDPAALGGDSGNTFIYDYPIITNDNLNDWLGKIDSFRKGDSGNLELAPLTPDEIREKWFLD